MKLSPRTLTEDKSTEGGMSWVGYASQIASPH